MRRKISPFALDRHDLEPRALRPARAASFLPTAASIAALLATASCSTPMIDVVAADPATKPMPVAPAAAPSASASVEPYIDPDPHEVEGKISNVHPTKSK